MMQVFLISLLFLISCKEKTQKQEPALSTVTDEDCDSPDASANCCFVHMPKDLSNSMTIASAEEPGPRLTLRGKIIDQATEEPIAGAILYAYHTDHTGYYSKNGAEQGVQKWHGRLHGWCKTDDAGNYEIRTIRPAPYPGEQAPAHVHVVIRLPGGKAIYVNDFVFSDDTLVNERYRRHAERTPDHGIVTLESTADGFVGVRNIMSDGQGL